MPKLVPDGKGFIRNDGELGLLPWTTCRVVPPGPRQCVTTLYAGKDVRLRSSRMWASSSVATHVPLPPTIHTPTLGIGVQATMITPELWATMTMMTRMADPFSESFSCHLAWGGLIFLTRYHLLRGRVQKFKRATGQLVIIATFHCDCMI